MPEYLEHRCCMCPNHGLKEITCPGLAGTPHTMPSPCRFVKEFVDDRGWRHKVMEGLGESNYKARFLKPGKAGWHCMRQLEWRNSFDAAQSDLNAYAKAKGWEEYV